MGAAATPSATLSHMGIITQIRRNVKNKRRCTIMVDGAFFCACDEDVVLSLELRRGMELSADVEHRLKREERTMQLRQKAWTYCTYKPRTEAQMRSKCQMLGMTDEETTATLSWLAEFKQLDDASYAQRFVDAARERKPLSTADIRSRLRRKGIPDNHIEGALATTTELDDIEAARRVAERKLRALASADNARDRLTRFLAYRRYSWNVIRVVVSELLPIVLFCIASQALVASKADTSCKPTLLPWSVNQWQPTTMPVLSSTGKLLYLDRKYHPDNTDGTTDADDVWVSPFDSLRGWLEPQRLQLTVGIPQPQVVFQESSDGLRLLVAGEYQDSRRLCFAILRRSSVDAPFTEFDIVRVTGALNLSGRYFATMTDDGQHLIVALPSAGGVDDLDMYHTSNCLGSWSDLTPLRGGLNTGGFDGAPYLAADGRTLYFVSNGREPRRGKLDVYVSRRGQQGWTDWTTPTWLGPCVNTIGDETTITLYSAGQRALLTSWDASEGRESLYSVTLADSVRPYPWCALEIYVRDAMRGTPLPGASVLVFDSTAPSCPRRLVANGQGIVTTTLQQHTSYQLRTEASGYTTVPQTLTIQQLDSVTPLRLTAHLFDMSIPLASVYFDRGTFEVTASERQRLVQLIDSLGIRSIGLKITGYTDELGAKPFNQTLSSQRAMAVVDALVVLGFNPSRIVSEGRGVEIPKIATSMRENPQSRRVDIFAITDPRQTTPQAPQRPARPSSSGRRLRQP